MGLLQVFDNLGEKRVSCFCHHQVIGKSDRFCFGNDDAMSAEKVAVSGTDNVQVGIDAPVGVQDKIAGGIDSLYCIRVRPIGFQKPGVLISDEIFQLCVCPQDVLPRGMELLPGGNGMPPTCRYFAGFPGLMDYCVDGH